MQLDDIAWGPHLQRSISRHSIYLGLELARHLVGDVEKRIIAEQEPRLEAATKDIHTDEKRFTGDFFGSIALSILGGYHAAWFQRNLEYFSNEYSPETAKSKLARLHYHTGKTDFRIPYESCLPFEGVHAKALFHLEEARRGYQAIQAEHRLIPFNKLHMADTNQYIYRLTRPGSTALLDEAIALLRDVDKSLHPESYDMPSALRIANRLAGDWMLSFPGPSLVAYQKEAEALRRRWVTLWDSRAVPKAPSP
jgi:hypothetical protein